MAIILGLIAALAYGLSDFVAGLLSRRVHYALVALAANFAATALSVAALLITAPAAPGVQALAWGAASGIGSGFGTLMLFRGLALGRMGVVAPLSAVGTAVLPVLIGIGLGDRPSPVAWIGVALALPAIWLVSTSGRPATDAADARDASGTPAKPRALASGAIEGLLAGLGFALLLVGLNLAGDGAGPGPLSRGR